MKLYRKGNIWYVDVWVDQERHRVSTGERLKPAAEKQAKDIVRRLQTAAGGGNGDPYAVTRTTPLVDLAERYADHLENLGKADEHVRTVRARLVLLFEAGGLDRIAQVNAESGGAALGALTRERGIGPNTKREYAGTAAAMWTWLIEAGKWSGTNPWTKLKKRITKVDPDGRAALTWAEVDRLVENAGRHRGVVYRLAATSGLRRNELRQLRWTDVDLDGGTVRARGAMAKDSKTVRLPLSPKAQDALRAWRETSPPTTREARVFRSIPEMETFRRDLAAAGIAEVRSDGSPVVFHSLRHTLATNLAREGAAPAKVQRLLRHKDIELTMRYYTHIDEEDLGGLLVNRNEDGDADGDDNRHHSALLGALAALGSGGGGNGGNTPPVMRNEGQGGEEGWCRRRDSNPQGPLSPLGPEGTERVQGSGDRAGLSDALAMLVDLHQSGQLEPLLQIVKALKL